MTTIIGLHKTTTKNVFNGNDLAEDVVYAIGVQRKKQCMVGNISGVAGKPVFFLQIKANADGEPIVLFAFRKSFGMKSCMSLRPASMYKTP